MTASLLLQEHFANVQWTKHVALSGKHKVTNKVNKQMFCVLGSGD